MQICNVDHSNKNVLLPVDSLKQLAFDGLTTIFNKKKKVLCSNCTQSTLHHDDTRQHGYMYYCMAIARNTTVIDLLVSMHYLKKTLYFVKRQNILWGVKQHEHF